MIRLAALVGGLMLLAACAGLILTAWVSSDALRDRFVAEGQRHLTAPLTFERLALRWLPVPHLRIEHIFLPLDPRLQLQIDELRLEPRLLPLLAGRWETAAIHSRRPRLWWQLPDEAVKPGPQEPPAKEAAALAFFQGVGPLLSWLTREFPQTTLSIATGQVEIQGREGLLLRLDALQVRAHSRRRSFDCQLWGEAGPGAALAMEVRLDPANWRGDGRIEMSRFPFAELVNRLSPAAVPRQVKASGDVRVTFHVQGLDSLAVEFAAALPDWEMELRRKHLLLHCRQVTGSLRLEGSALEVDLQRLELHDPAVTMSGALRLDRALPAAQLRLEAAVPDVADLRQTALDLAGEDEGVRSFCRVLHGGRVEQLVLECGGTGWRELVDPARWNVRCRLEGAHVVVPNLPLEIHEAGGDLRLAEGVLEGFDCRGQIGRSRVSWGEFAVGLSGAKAPFHLAADLTADLGQLHEFLTEVIPDNTFQQGVQTVTAVQGQASGRLVLTGATPEMDVRAQISRFYCSGRSTLIPFPIWVNDGELVFEPGRLAVTGVSGGLGRSHYSGLTARLDWKAVPHLEVDSASAYVALEELQSWLGPHVSESFFHGPAPLIRGDLFVKDLSFAGNLERRARPSFRLTATFDRLEASGPPLPATLSLRAGNFMATETVLTIGRCEVTLGDTTMKGSAVFRGSGGNLQGLQYEGSGTLGPATGDWLRSVLKLPAMAGFTSPLEVSSVAGSWQHAGPATLTARMVTHGGLEVTLKDLRHEGPSAGGGFALSGRAVGRGTQATFAIRVDGAGTYCVGRGHVERASLMEWRGVGLLPASVVEGDFEGFLARYPGKKLKVTGNVEFLGLELRGNLPAPLTISKATLVGKGESVEVEALLDLGDHPLRLAGWLGAAESGLEAHLAVRADDLSHSDLHVFTAVADAPPPKTSLSRKILGHPLRLSLEFEARQVELAGYPFRSLQVVVDEDGGEPRVAIRRGDLCGIGISGVTEADRGVGTLRLQFAAHRQELGAALSCLWEGQHMATGSLDLQGVLVLPIAGQGRIAAMRGELRATATDGRIYRAPLLVKILALINMTQVVRGQVPDIIQSGLGYRSMRCNGEIRDGRLVLTDGFIDGSSLRIFCEGHLDLSSTALDLMCLVNPLTSVDDLLSNLPLANRWLSGPRNSVATIPVSVTGTLDNPTVTILPVGAVASGILGRAQKLFQLPLTVVEGLISATGR